MANNKSIDGLSPRRQKKTASTVSADGFTPLMQPRKTARGAKSATKKTPSASSVIHPEEFIPPRKTTKISVDQPEPDTDTASLTDTTTETTSDSSAKPTRQEINEEFLKPTKIFDFDEETGELKTVKDNPAENGIKNQKKSQSNDSAKGTPKKAKKKWSKKRKFWTWFLSILFLLIIVGAVVFVLFGNDLLARITGGRGNLMDLFSENYAPLKEDKYGRTNILAFGTSGFDMEGTEYGGGVHDGANLTDSIMIISFDQDTGDADLISLPRDLKVDAGCNYTGKINEVYTCNNPDENDEEAGAEALMDEISDVLGIDLPYYVHVNWGSLKDVVDDIGGVTVTLDEPIADYDYTGAVYEAGVPYTLSGQDAIALARARHGTEHGDFSRGASQQKILLGIKDKIMQDGLSVTNLVSLANTLGDNLRTNFSISEIKTLAHLATSIDWENITEASFLEPEPLLTDGTIDGISYVYPTAGVSDFSEIKAYIKGLLSSSTASDSSTNTVASEDASILVLNATSQAGLAAAEETSLESAGFDNITIDNLTGVTYPAKYTLYSFTTDAPTTQSALEKHYSITTSPNPPSYLPTGYDFILIIGD